MSSPKEPGHAGPGDGAGSRPAPPSGRGSEQGPPAGGETPPWQRGPGSRTPQSAPRPSGEAPGRPEQQRPAAPAPGADNRATNRYVTGTAAPAALQPPQAPAESDSSPVRTKEYASELPDLSGPAPRPAQQRRPASEPVAAPRSGSGGRVQVAGRGKQGPVRASMQIRRIDPWSALKVSLLLSIAMFFVWMIAVAIMYLVLGGMGVWSKLNSNVGDLLTSTSGSGGELVSSGTIFGGALLIGLVNIVLLTAMATVGAFIYNLITDIVGGVEVTLADRD
ncbi:MAG: DUF3566 domain-containing protein [Mycobacterium sp.]